MAVVFTSNMVGCAAAQNGIAVSVADTEALFSQLEELAPPTIMLKRLECRGGRVIVAGESDTLSAVSGYMLKIDHAGWKPSLNRIERHDKHQIFLLTVRATREDDVICSEGISKHQNL